MNKKTKIVATIGPASENGEVIEKLILAGVNLFRFNLKHNDFDWHQNTIKKVREIAKKLDYNIGTIADLQGPEVRIETFEGKEVEIKEGESLFIGPTTNSNKTITLNPKEVISNLEVGDTAFIDDGDLELQIIGSKNGVVEAKVEIDYIIKNRKSLNILKKTIDLPLLSERDLVVLEMIPKIDPDYIALSFVRTKEDIETLRSKLKEIGATSKIIAKIENSSAINNLEEIIKVTDAVMVARGDLGVEVAMGELAFWQKRMIDLSRKYNKPVIVATQMMQSMVHNYHPTRAEATDVANAIFDGTDALMLSEETATGDHPVKVIKEMNKIAEFCEKNGVAKSIELKLDSTTEVLVRAAANIIKNSGQFPIKAIIVFTESGDTARILSKYRFKIPIVAVTNNSDTVRSLALSYGVLPLLKEFPENQFRMEDPIFKKLINFEFIEKDDNVLVIHGNNWMTAGQTSDISLIKV